MIYIFWTILSSLYEIIFGLLYNIFYIIIEGALRSAPNYAL